MSPFTSPPTITGETVVLRPITADDAQDLDHVLSHPAVNRISLGALDFNEASRRAYRRVGVVEEAAAASGRARYAHFALVDDRSGVLEGGQHVLALEVSRWNDR